MNTAFLPATELARSIRDGELSSVELVELYLERIARLGPLVNAIVTLDEDGARRRAHEADEALTRGELWGPLHGVPVTVKDAFDTAGLRTTGGLEHLQGYVPVADAVVVSRYREAGAVVLGKTNVPVNSADWQTFNPMFGQTNCPWDLARTPGGSSGGSAAALSAGITGLEIASDAAGSIRIPASWCGVYGLKPSFGTVPLRGRTPPGAPDHAELLVAGPMGRSVDDLELGLEIVGGPLDEHAKAWRLQFPPSRAQDLADFRVGIWLDDAFCPIDAETSRILRTTVQALIAAGADIRDDGRPIDPVDSYETYWALLMGGSARGMPAEAFTAMVDALNRRGESTVEDPLDLRPAGMARTMERLRAQRLWDWHRFDERRLALKSDWHDYFTTHDVLLTPVVLTSAIPHDQNPDRSARTIIVDGASRPYEDLRKWVCHAAVGELPAVVVPVGATSSGLPVGIQIIGPFLEDKTTLQFARLIEQLVGGFVPPPLFAGDSIPVLDIGASANQKEAAWPTA